MYMEDWTKMDQNDADIILFSQSQMNHYHSELWSKELNARYSWGKCSFEHGYHIQKAYDADSTIFIAFNNNAGVLFLSPQLIPLMVKRYLTRLLSS